MMTVDRKAAERETRKELILEGALAVFKEKGLAGAKIDEIARASGFGKATLYYYFSSKEEIFNALLLHGWLKLWHDLEDLALGGDSPRRTFIGMLKRIAELINANRPLYEFLFFAPRANSPEENEKAEWKKYQTRLYRSGGQGRSISTNGIPFSVKSLGWSISWIGFLGRRSRHDLRK